MNTKPISGFEGIYSVTPDGDIISHRRNNSILKPHVKKCGYSYVGLRRGLGDPSYRRIHRLVAEAFIPNPENKPHVNHIDGVKTNNVVDNLEWVTRSENMQHAHDNGLMPQGQDHHASKLTPDQVVEIYLSPLSYIKTAKLFPVCAQTVCNIKKRRIYKSLTEGL